MGRLLWYRKINDVEKTMDEINEQNESLKQIQDAIAAPFSGQEFDEVMVQEICFTSNSNL